MPDAVSEKKLEKRLEKDLEPRLERDIEKEVEKNFEPAMEKRIEKKIEKDIGRDWKLTKDLGIKTAFVGVSKGLLSKSSVSIHVDDYDFIFSDFDPRPFSKRALSEDFLREARRFAVESKAGSLELDILIPKSSRNLEVEATVKKRLRDNFRNGFEELRKEHDWLVKKGIFMAIAGFAMTIGAACVSFYLGQSSLLFVILFVVLEPAGWFTFWTGLDQLFYEARKERPELEFYEKMSKADISFSSY